jgi:hypothetical protein
VLLTLLTNLFKNASGCLWTLSTSSSTRKFLMQNEKAIPSLWELLCDGSLISRENVFGIFSHLLVDSPLARERILMKQGAITKIVQGVMFGVTYTSKENAALCVLALSDKNEQVQLQFADEGKNYVFRVDFFLTCY